jgi:hypothetical protein
MGLCGPPFREPRPETIIGWRLRPPPCLRLTRVETRSPRRFKPPREEPRQREENPKKNQTAARSKAAPATLSSVEEHGRRRAAFAGADCRDGRAKGVCFPFTLLLLMKGPRGARLSPPRPLHADVLLTPEGRAWRALPNRLLMPLKFRLPPSAGELFRHLFAELLCAARCGVDCVDQRASQATRLERV